MNSPGASAVPLRDWDFGRGLRGYAWAAATPRAALLLQHGFCEYSKRYVRHYNRLIPQLLAAGIDVYAFDLRGHGRSPGARAITDIREAVQDHLAARRALQTQPLPVFLFGHSLGGLVTAASVAEDPAGIRGVVLSSPLLDLHSNAAMRLLAKVLHLLAPSLVLVRSNLHLLSRIPEEVRLAEADPMFCKTRGVSARLAATALFTIGDARRHYPRWVTPVLVFHGTADRMTAAADSERFIETIAAKDKTLRLFDDGYHELLNDLDRDEALRLVLGWLEARMERPS